MAEGRRLVDPGRLALVAITHHRAPLEVLERVSMTTDDAAALARALVGTAGIDEVAVISTCNRTELYLHGPHPDPEIVLATLAAQRGAPLDLLRDAATTAADQDAAVHLLRVATGLESRVVGEAEIAGQVKAAIAAAQDAGVAGPHLHGLFRFAIAAGRRARSTRDRSLTPSLPRLALDTVAGDAPLTGPTVVLGSGTMAASTVRELAARRIDYWVCARRADKAARLVTRPDRVIDFAALPSFLHRADLVFCATGARSPLVRMADLQAATEARRPEHPLTVVDLSMPRNVEPEARQLPGVRLVDLDDLVEHSTAALIRHREDVVTDEARRYRAWLAGRAVAPLLVQLHDRIHSDCQRMIERSATATSPQISARRVANKLLHGPTVTIKDLIAAGDEDAALAVLATYGITRPALAGPAGLPLTDEAT